MFSVSQLAKRHQLSRSTILYYERTGLLAPTLRGENGYRWYNNHQDAQLAMIVSYRALGVPVNSG